MSSKPTAKLRQRSAVFFVFLNQLPRWVPLVVLPALLVAGLALPGAAGAAPLVLLALLLWFTFLAVPTRTPAHRLVRLAVPVVLVAVAVAKLLS